MKDVWNIAAVIPSEKAMTGNNGSNASSCSHSGELIPVDNFLGICTRELLARGCELLKRTRNGTFPSRLIFLFYFTKQKIILLESLLSIFVKSMLSLDAGDLHWKIVSVYVNGMNQVNSS